MSIFEKKEKYAEPEKAEDSVQDNETDKEGEGENMDKVSFFSKHKKGILIGGAATLLGGLAALVISRHGDDDLGEYDDEFDDEFDAPDDSEDPAENDAE